MKESVLSRCKATRPVKAGTFSGQLMLQEIQKYDLPYSRTDLEELTTGKPFPLNQEDKDDLTLMMREHARVCSLVPIGSCWVVDIRKLCIRDLFSFIFGRRLNIKVLQYLYIQWYARDNLLCWVTHNSLKAQYVCQQRNN